MFDTYLTIVGNVLTAPEWRRTTQTGALVANFKVASTARRLDRERGQWVDGNSLRVRVNCWRKLAAGVCSSVTVGDPIIVFGRMYTRDWTDETGTHRTLYEMEAVAVGHDLSRGHGRFRRNGPTATSAVEDDQSITIVQGQSTEAVAAEEAPTQYDNRPFEDDFDLPPMAGESPVERDSRVLLDRLPGEGDHDSDGPTAADLTGQGEPDGADSLGASPAGDLIGETPDGGDGSAEDLDGDGDGDGESGGLPRRGRRARGRVPIPA
nr:single-stranded DNA-binding protein [Micromonospora sp. DSM 115978]